MLPAMSTDLTVLRDRLRAFALERAWAPFHSPKNLACALSVEAAELLEHFQWLTEDQSRDPGPAERDAIALEAADVLLYLVQLADQLDIDLLSAADRKIGLNALKYPVETARGNSRKAGSRG
jgi:dCTP diphosphatase